MIDPSSLATKRIILEARFGRRMAFLDHTGEIVDELEGSYPEFEVLPAEVRFSDPEKDLQLVVGAQRVWVSVERDELSTAVGVLQDAVDVLMKYLNVFEFEFLGARQVLLAPLGEVSQATALFRSTFFDYRQSPYSVFGGDPVEAQAIMGYRHEGGMCRVVATSVYTGGEVVGDSAPGALLLDVDRTCETVVEAWDVEFRARELLTDARDRALDFVSRLRLTGTSTEQTGGDEHAGGHNGDS